MTTSCPTETEIYQFIQENPWCNAIDVRDHFGQHGTTHIIAGGGFLLLHSTTNQFYSTLCNVLRRDDVRVKPDLDAMVTEPTFPAVGDHLYMPVIYSVSS